MDIPQRIGIAIDFGVPVIIGGGLVRFFADSWGAVAAYEVLLIVILLSIVLPSKES
ncbi:MAG: hypothetical protein ACNY01_01945 [Desulfobacteria bacterium]|jgi:hypothetical protein|nr:hypothetical protein [Pseudomonadota bacterium]MCK5244574.1 hypothetical protein [Desulfobacterales bacterium]MDL1973506.1 hypothetical protein [Deltaproteobacteria bacterium]MDL1976926.1 hypothetical protein [Deltaproteobacteria bacterium]